MSFQHMKVCFPVIISFLKCFVASVKICKAKNSKFPCYLNGKIEVLTGTCFCNAKAKSLELGTFYDQNFTKKPGEQSFSTKSKNRSTLIYIHIYILDSSNLQPDLLKVNMFHARWLCKYTNQL